MRPAKQKAPRTAIREAFETSNPNRQAEVYAMTYSHPRPDATGHPRGVAVQTLHLPDRTNQRLLLEAYDALRAIALGDVCGEDARELAHTTAARLDLLGVK